jgi:hypothetical protein
VAKVVGLVVHPVVRRTEVVPCLLPELRNVAAIMVADIVVGRLMAGDDHASIFASSSTPTVRVIKACAYYDMPEMLPFFVRIGFFDPAPVMPLVPCLVFAAFGRLTTPTPVYRSVGGSLQAAAR